MSETGSKLDVVKWIAGILASLIVLAISIFTSVISNHAEMINENKQNCTVLSARQDDIREILREIRGDLKELLKYREKEDAKNN